MTREHTRRTGSTTPNPVVPLSDFTCLEDSHPFGVLPGGNQFLGGLDDSSSSSSRRRHRPSAQTIFDDKLWQHILGFCDGRSLGQVVQVSQYLYVAGHQPELWRDLVLRYCHTNKIVISNVGSSWRDTYLLLYCPSNVFVSAP